MMADEWKVDADNSPRMDKERFFDAMFTVVDLWTEDTKAVTYVSFLEGLNHCVQGVHQRATEIRKQMCALIAVSSPTTLL